MFIVLFSISVTWIILYSGNYFNRVDKRPKWLNLFDSRSTVEKIENVKIVEMLKILKCLKFLKCWTIQKRLQ